jgi:C-terminal processing protease CtpA/Prc
MGMRSFGRGSEQTIIPFGGRSGALRLATGRYFTPAGRSFDGPGIDPDVEVLQDVPANQDNDKALTLHTSCCAELLHRNRRALHLVLNRIKPLIGWAHDQPNSAHSTARRHRAIRPR